MPGGAGLSSRGWAACPADLLQRIMQTEKWRGMRLLSLEDLLRAEVGGPGAGRAPAPVAARSSCALLTCTRLQSPGVGPACPPSPAQCVCKGWSSALRSIPIQEQWLDLGEQGYQSSAETKRKARHYARWVAARAPAVTSEVRVPLRAGGLVQPGTSLPLAE